MAQRRLIGLLVALIGGGLILWAVFAQSSSLAPDVADGRYANPCCGTVLLKGGTMTAGAFAVSYVAERDGGGAYLLPDHYIGVTRGQGFDPAHGKDPAKLRLDRAERPAAIDLPSDNGRMVRFVREAGQR